MKEQKIRVPCSHDPHELAARGATALHGLGIGNDTGPSWDSGKVFVDEVSGDTVHTTLALPCGSSWKRAGKVTFQFGVAALRDPSLPAISTGYVVNSTFRRIDGHVASHVSSSQLLPGDALKEALQKTFHDSWDALTSGLQMEGYLAAEEDMPTDQLKTHWPLRATALVLANLATLAYLVHAVGYRGEEHGDLAIASDMVRWYDTPAILGISLVAILAIRLSWHFHHVVPMHRANATALRKLLRKA